VVLPPAPATQLEMLETNVDKVIIKGIGVVGTISVSGITVTVSCKEDVDTTANRKLLGLVIGFGNPPNEDRTVIDYDEVAPMIDACDFFGHIDWSVTSLSSFSATYLTKAGLRVNAFSSRRSDIIEFSLHSSRMERSLRLSGTQLAQFRNLLEQARHKLGEIKTAG